VWTLPALVQLTECKSSAVVPESRVAERTEGYKARRIRTRQFAQSTVYSVCSLRLAPVDGGCRVSLGIENTHFACLAPDSLGCILPSSAEMFLPGLRLSREMEEFLNNFYYGLMVYCSLN
jgi:hypothetical protein